MALKVRIDYSPVYELISSYMLFTHRKWIRNVDHGSDWVKEVSNQLSEPLLELSDKIGNVSINEYDTLYAASLEREAPYSVPAFLNQLKRMSSLDWREMLNVYGIDVTDALLERLQHYFIPALELWYNDYFEASIPDWEQTLIDDANEKMQLWRKMNPAEIIEVASNGVVFDMGDKLHEVILAPLWHYRPINNTCMFRDRSLLMYAVDVPEIDQDVPPVALKRMIYALTHDVRLRILRFISQKPATFIELSEHVQLGKSALRHHLVILRAAGYLRTYWNGEVERIALRQEGLADLSVFLEDYVHLDG